MRDFRQLLANEPFVDREAEAKMQKGEAPRDVMLQNREEVLALCEWIEAHDIKSYLEIGIWTGRLVSLLHRLFHFDKIAVCDNAMAGLCGLPLHLPDGTIPFWGPSQSPYYPGWRKRLGHVDLVFIDGDHSYEGVKQDFLNNVEHPHRFLAFHDVLGGEGRADGARRFWQELPGHKLELFASDPALRTPDKGMGIGIWWK